MPVEPPKQQKPGVSIGAPRKRIEIFDHHDEPARFPASVWWALGVVVVAILIGFFAVPAYKGYMVYQDMKASGVPDTYASDMAKLQSDKAAAESVAALAAQKSSDAEAKRQAAESSFAVCQEEATEAQDRAEQETNRLTADLDVSRSDLETCTEGRAEDASVMSDAARRICCVQRIENPAINSYVINNGKIACVQDGGTAISC